jgi:hypothetical protein
MATMDRKDACLTFNKHAHHNRIGDEGSTQFSKTPELHGNVYLSMRPSLLQLECHYLNETMTSISDSHAAPNCQSAHQYMAGSVDTAIDYSSVDVYDNDFVASALGNELQDHRGKDLTEQYPRNSMMNMWDWHEPMDELFAAPSLAPQIGYAFTSVQNTIHDQLTALQRRSPNAAALAQSGSAVPNEYATFVPSLVPQNSAMSVPEDLSHTVRQDAPTQLRWNFNVIYGTNDAPDTNSRTAQPRGPASNVIDLTSSTGDSSTDSDAETDLEVVIGSVMNNGRFKCAEHGCYRRSFGRQAELRRHYYGAHTKKLAYWCEVVWCDRSQAIGTRPFPRKDKLMAHVRSIHGERA